MTQPAVYIDGTEWNTVTVNGAYQGPVGGVDGILQIPPNGGRKFLMGAMARWDFNGAPPATAPLDWMVRVLIAYGNLDISDPGGPNPPFSMAADGASNVYPNTVNFNGVRGLTKILVDILVPLGQCPWQLVLPEPIIIPTNVPLNMLMGRPIDNAFNEATSNVSVNYMTLFGWDEGTRDLNVKLR